MEDEEALGGGGGLVVSELYSEIAVDICSFSFRVCVNKNFIHKDRIDFLSDN